MTDFHFKDFEAESKTVVIRLADRSYAMDGSRYSYHTTVSQATFTVDGPITLERFRTHSTTQAFQLSHEEMQMLVNGWHAYQTALEQHAVETEKQEQATIAEAYTLAKSMHFDLDDLNIQIEYPEEGERWTIRVPALGFERYAALYELKEVVLGIIRDLHANMEHAEAYNWGIKNEQWQAIIASYRRVCPRNDA